MNTLNQVNDNLVLVPQFDNTAAGALGVSPAAGINRR